MARMHADEIEIDEPLVRELLSEQFPEWAGRALRRAEPSGAPAGRGIPLAAREADARYWLSRFGGDPAGDLMVAFKLHSPSARDAFIGTLGADDASWERARGWAVSQAVAILAYYTPHTNPILYAEAQRWLALALQDR